MHDVPNMVHQCFFKSITYILNVIENFAIFILIQFYVVFGCYYFHWDCKKFVKYCNT